jgi:hypothetical protein
MRSYTYSKLLGQLFSIEGAILVLRKVIAQESGKRSEVAFFSLEKNSKGYFLMPCDKDGKFLEESPNRLRSLVLRHFEQADWKSWSKSGLPKDWQQSGDNVPAIYAKARQEKVSARTITPDSLFD